MARKRIAMRKIREVLQLALVKGMSGNEIQRSTDVSRGSVQEFLRRAKSANLTWQDIERMDNIALELLLYPPAKSKDPIKEIDWQSVHLELKRKGVTIELLWREYKEKDPTGFCYAHFTKKYRRWRNKTINLVMRQEHHAGEKLFVDFAGDTKAVINRETGEVRFAHIFVAVLGASNYCFVYACWSEDLPSWITAHVKAFEFFGGVPKFVVPDNLKSAVTKACRFDPVLNRTYRRLAQHYSFAIMPARPASPKDKGKVEAGVKLVQNWILGALRNHEFFSLEQLNESIAALLTTVNEKPFQKLPGCRRSWFESVDLPTLNPLPPNQFEFESWKSELTVPRNYHIEIDGHHYSVSHKLVGEKVDARITGNFVELFHNDQRVASHLRSAAQAKKSTSNPHMPRSHAEYAGQSPERFIKEAQLIGPATTAVIIALLDSKPYPQLSFGQCFGLLRSFKKQFSASEVEQACQYALQLGSPSYKLIKEILSLGLDNIPKQVPINIPVNIQHPNIRGPEYYS